DIVALSPDAVDVLLNNDDGTFSPLAPVSFSGSNLSSLAVGDLNGDGNADLVVSDLADSTIKICLGNADGTFGTAKGSAVGVLPTSVALAHLHSPGILDLIVASAASDTVSVLPGNGDGTFGVGTDYAVGTGPSRVLAADINADSKLDLV